MKCGAVVLTIFCAVALGQVADDAPKNENHNDDDRWIWGNIDDNKKENKTEDRNSDQLSTSTVFPPYDDPCTNFSLIKPSFSAPGRTISGEKCEEYKWDKLYEEETVRRNHECYQKINEGKPPPPATVGGRPTLAGEFPHMGAIGWKTVVEGYVFRCGGTLISSKFVLTAAHCSRASSADTSLADPVPKIVRLNDKNIYHTYQDLQHCVYELSEYIAIYKIVCQSPLMNETGYFFSEDVNISRVIVHPEFKPPKKYFDIALLELDHEVTFTWLMQPACLWSKRDVSELGDEATLTGWGVLRQGSSQISPELQAAVVDIINSTYCDQLLLSSQNRNWWGLQENQLCAGKLAGGVDSCQGDSGGPLQVKQPIPGSAKESVYYVIGVTSFGIGCALPNIPGIYTRVSSFVPWIEPYVWPQV